MSVEAPARQAEAVTAVDEVVPEVAPMPEGSGGAQGAGATGLIQEEKTVNAPLTALAVFVAMGGAAWMSSRLFRGGPALLIAMAGCAIGAGLVGLSWAHPRLSPIKYLVPPVAVVMGTFLMEIAAGKSTAPLLRLLIDPLRSGGLAQPPVPFDPGWRLVLLLVFALVSATGVAIAFAINRASVSVFVSIPIMMALGMILPAGTGARGGTIGLVLLLGSLAIAQGVDLGKDGSTSRDFELRRLARSAGLVVVATSAVLLLSQAGLLFPAPVSRRQNPPQRPRSEGLGKDAVLFTVKSDQPGPWRLGVLDIYSGEWLLAPSDALRERTVPADGLIPDRNQGGKPQEATFTLKDLSGHSIPDLSGTRMVVRKNLDLRFDPRTELLRLPSKQAASGISYTVRATPLPTALDLVSAPPPVANLEFLSAPPPPPEVVSLLAGAPKDSLWKRLQYVRDAFYQKVVAAGEGRPVAVSPARVVQMLAGGEATPYEIPAAEALLARWAGVPARLGYGYVGGERNEKTGVLEVHPRHGAVWLEASFEGHGWLPIVRVPQSAKASFSTRQKQLSPNSRTAGDLSMIAYVPIKLAGLRLRVYYDYTRYWLSIAVPVAAGIALIWAFYPGPLKSLRTLRRRRFARRSEPRLRIATAYAELRDAAADLGLGMPSATPLEFLEAVAPDTEHYELAWLVTRSLWGDLRRDLRQDYAQIGEEMAISVTRRVRHAQLLLTRLLSFGSRASLRQPYSTEIPNLWRRPRERTARRARAVPAGMRMSRRLSAAGAILALLGVGCGAAPRTPGQAPAPLPVRIAPDVLGALAFKIEPAAEKSFQRAGNVSLVRDAAMLSIRGENQVQGYLEVATFKAGLGLTGTKLREGVLASMPAGRFEPERVGRDLVYVTRSPEQAFALWFSPANTYFELLVAGQRLADPDRLLAALIAYQRGEEAMASLRFLPHVVDPRRGEED